MFENIIVSVISGLITTAILEGVKKMRGGKEAAVVEAPPEASARTLEPAPPQAPAPARSSRAGFWVRLIVSPLAGFLLGGLTAGLLEAGGEESIEFGSTLANVLIVGWTVVVWLFLSRRKGASASP